MRGLLHIASFLLLFSAPLQLLAAQVYTWVDAQNVTHFSSEPPTQEAAKKINTKVFQPELVDKTPTEGSQAETKSQAEINNEVRKQVAAETAELKKYCTEMRYNLAQLENNPRVLATVDGKPSRLSEEERQARIAEVKEALSKHCANLK